MTTSPATFWRRLSGGFNHNSAHSLGRQWECGTTSLLPHSIHNIRYKAKEIEFMRNKQSLAMLKAMVSSMAPARDFKAAIMQKAKETGERPSTQN